MFEEHFPVLVLRDSLADSAKILTAIAKKLEIEAELNITNEADIKSCPVELGYQTRDNFLLREDPEIKLLRALVEPKIESYIDEFYARSNYFKADAPVSRPRPLRIDYNFSSFGVVSGKNAYQSSHIHSSGIFTGVIYLKVPNGLEFPQGYLEFESPRIQGSYLRVASQGMFAPIECPSQYIKPSSYDFLMFPSYYRHAVHPSLHNDNRVLVSFDVFPTEVY